MLKNSSYQISEYQISEYQISEYFTLSSSRRSSSNNYAESEAINRSFNWILYTKRVQLTNFKSIYIFSDSTYAINIITNNWPANSNFDLIASIRRHLEHHSLKKIFKNF